MLTYQLAKETADLEAIASLAATGGELAQLGLTANPATPIEVLRVLAYAKSDSVRLAALASRRCPPETLAAARDSLPRLVAAAEDLLRGGGASEETITTWRAGLREAGLIVGRLPFG